jgi:predicted RNA-binding protein YlqC (UPF0109 family)
MNVHMKYHTFIYIYIHFFIHSFIHFFIHSFTLILSFSLFISLHRLSLRLFHAHEKLQVTLSSESAASLDAAQSLMLLAIAQDHSNKFQEIGIIVENHLAGRVIGKGGERIQELRACCESCQMSEDSVNNERVLIVGGDILQMTKTTRMVSFLNKYVYCWNKMYCEYCSLIHGTRELSV